MGRLQMRRAGTSEMTAVVVYHEGRINRILDMTKP